MEMVLQPRGSSSGAAGASTTTCRPGAATAKPPAPRTTTKQEKEEEDEAAGYELRRGPWTVDEDFILINYITEHGEGRWNALARAAGLKRTGKSCRLRWLNYLRPDVKRGDFTADEQLLILDLHSRWGNRWSKIAQQLPGRTDNEIKNYWRTRVQKHARQLGCDVNSRRFKDAMTYLWMPRLAERATAASQHGQQPVHSVFGAIAGNSNDAATVANQSSSSPCLSALTATTPACLLATDENNNSYYHSPGASGSCGMVPSSSSSDSSLTSTESMHEEKSLTNNGGDCWTTTTTMQGVDHDEFWSTAAPALQELMVNDNTCQHHHQFQEDLITGWVQGFSEGISSDAADHNSLWSLDDMIWRMQ